MLQLFVQKYNQADFTELNQFEPFKDIMEDFFIKKTHD